jgi:phosphoribosylamine--glycine ligase
MKILVIGSGGREHALAWKLARSPDAERIFCAPGNAGTAEIAENVAISSDDLKALIRFARENRIDLTVIGPDDPLAAGIVDLFAAEKLRAFGPTKSAARIEASKIFAKELMRAQKIPTAEARTFTDSSEALDYCERLKFPVVIKADGLALGKGVIIASDAPAARSAIDEMMTEGRFGDAGRRIVIEDFYARNRMFSSRPCRAKQLSPAGIGARSQARAGRRPGPEYWRDGCVQPSQ